MKLETTLEQQEEEWGKRYKDVERERDLWKKAVKIEQIKNQRLLDHANKKQQEIQRMFQRKYESNQQGGGGGQKSSNPRQFINQPYMNQTNQQRHERATTVGPISHKSPRDFLQASNSLTSVQKRNATKSLVDFFGMC